MTDSRKIVSRKYTAFNLFSGSLVCFGYIAYGQFFTATPIKKQELTAVIITGTVLFIAFLFTVHSYKKIQKRIKTDKMEI